MRDKYCQALLRRQVRVLEQGEIRPHFAGNADQDFRGVEKRSLKCRAHFVAEGSFPTLRRSQR